MIDLSVDSLPIYWDRGLSATDIKCNKMAESCQLTKLLFLIKKFPKIEKIPKVIKTTFDHPSSSSSSSGNYRLKQKDKIKFFIV